MKVGELYRYTGTSFAPYCGNLTSGAICLYLGIEIVRDGGFVLERYRFLVGDQKYRLERQTLRHMEKINDC